MLNVGDGAFEGIRVLDLGRVLAAPLASQILADLGAEVIKVEQPVTGDQSRNIGPPFFEDDGSGERISAFFISCNRGKKSIAVDLTSAKGVQLIKDLAEKSDVFIENFKVGSLKRLGLDYEAIKAVNPSIVYCSITGYGQAGPYADQPGYDAVFQALSGMMSCTGQPDGTVGGGPLRTGVSLADVLTAYLTATSISSALYARGGKNGQGQYLDISLLDCTIASLCHAAQGYLSFGSLPERRGNAGYSGAPTDTFACQDGLIMISAGSDAHFPRLCRTIGREDLLEDSRFKTLDGRVRNRDELLALLRDDFLPRSKQEWFEIFRKASVPAGPVNDFDELFDDPQVVARKMKAKTAHPLFGDMDIIASPIKIAAADHGDYAPPPMLGEHTREVLSDILGLDDGEIAEAMASCCGGNAR